MGLAMPPGTTLVSLELRGRAQTSSSRGPFKTCFPVIIQASSVLPVATNAVWYS
jgi:hypothetical protein